MWNFFSNVDNQKYRSQALKLLMRVCNVQWQGEDIRNYIICVLIYDIDQMMQNVQNTEAGLAGQVVMMAVVAESADTCIHVTVLPSVDTQPR